MFSEIALHQWRVFGFVFVWLVGWLFFVFCFVVFCLESPCSFCVIFPYDVPSSAVCFCFFPPIICVTVAVASLCLGPTMRWECV